MSGLSATMVACIDDALAAGGELVRYQGGFWARRGSHPQANQTPSHGTSTVHAIVTRGYAKYSEHRAGRNGDFPIAVRLTELAYPPLAEHLAETCYQCPWHEGRPCPFDSCPTRATLSGAEATTGGVTGQSVPGRDAPHSEGSAA